MGKTNMGHHFWLFFKDCNISYGYERYGDGFEVVVNMEENDMAN
jgi:hypothetical protein